MPESPEHAADHAELEADRQWEEDCATVERAVMTLRETLEKAGLWENEHESGGVKIRAYARSGYPIEIDTDHG